MPLLVSSYMVRDYTNGFQFQPPPVTEFVEVGGDHKPPRPTRLAAQFLELGFDPYDLAHLYSYMDALLARTR